MSFRQRLIIILLIACFAVGLIYIGTVANKRKIEGEVDTSQNVSTVYFWYSDSDLTDYFTSAAVAFHEKNPDVRVIPVLEESIEYLESINEASLCAENFPDIYMLSNDSLEKAYLGGLASTVRDSQNVLNTDYFSQPALDAVTYKGVKTAYPLFFETTVLLYNKTYLEDWVAKLNEGLLNDNGEYGDEGDWEDEDEYFDEYDDVADGEYGFGDYAGGKTFESGITIDDLIPLTFDDIKGFAENYEAPADVEAVFKWDVTDVFYNYFFLGDTIVVGGDTGDDVSKLSIVNENAIASMQFYQDMNQYFSIDPASSEYNVMLDEFLSGKFVFTIVTSDAIKKIEHSIEERSKAMMQAVESGAEVIPSVYEFGYALIPNVTADIKSKSLSVTNVLAINGYSENKDAANRFATFLSTEYANELYNSTGKISSCYAIDYDNEAVDVFRSEYAKSMPLPKIVETSNLWVQIEITFTEIWQGADVNSMMEKLSEQIKSQLGIK